MRRLLGGDRQEVDRLVAVKNGLGIEPAGEKDFLDELVELGDVVFRDSRVFMSAASLSNDAATAIRASGVRSSWLQLASSRLCATTSSSMRWAERLKLSASAATSSLALDLDPGAEIVAEPFDAGLQPLQPAAEPAHHGVGADRDGERHQHQERRDPERRTGPFAHLAGEQPAPVRQLQGEVGAARAAAPAGARAPASKRGGGLPAMAIMAPLGR